MNKDIIDYAQSIGIHTCIRFAPAILSPAQNIRSICKTNQCSNYGTNYMCPPLIGSLPQIESRLQTFDNGFLLRFSQALNVKKDAAALRQSKILFHKKVLFVEKRMAQMKIHPTWAMIGGDCSLCPKCVAPLSKPCPFPNDARTSLEAIGIDVQALLIHLNQDPGFSPNKVTWSGCVLF